MTLVGVTATGPKKVEGQMFYTEITAPPCGNETIFIVPELEGVGSTPANRWKTQINATTGIYVDTALSV
jgi:hypothetical protein